MAEVPPSALLDSVVEVENFGLLGKFIDQLQLLGILHHFILGNAFVIKVQHAIAQQIRIGFMGIQYDVQQCCGSAALLCGSGYGFYFGVL